nr:glycerol transporter [Polyrhizophydium stewartii]
MFRTARRTESHDGAEAHGLLDSTRPHPLGSSSSAGFVDAPRTQAWRASLTGVPLLVNLALLLATVCSWAWSAVNFSRTDSPIFGLYRHKLTQGWLFGRPLDNSDVQYRNFRNQAHILVAVLIGHQLLGSILGLRLGDSPARATHRMAFSLVFSSIFLSVLFGTGLLKIAAVCLAHYVVLTRVLGPRWIATLFSWAFGIAVLFSVDALCDFKFASLGSAFTGLDSMRGMGMSPVFNFTVLRMISFSTDYYWQTGESARAFEKHKTDCEVCSRSAGEKCPTGRIQAPHKAPEYNLFNYLAYLFYAPLFLAGPIITFNDFVAQVHTPPKSVTLRRIAVAAVRWAAFVLLFEVLLHYMYVVAIKDTKAWKGGPGRDGSLAVRFTSFEMYNLGYWNLTHIWLKLLIIWRFFALWALADRVETVENMARCMSDQYSGIEFWNAWHKSFNRWIVRYLYVPLGGKKLYLLNVMVTFTFVAIWHEVRVQQLAWGWLIALFIVPEIACTRLLCTDEWRQRLGWLHLHLCALGGVCNVFMMMIANLVGYAVGVEGIQEMLDQIVHGKAWSFFAGVIPGLFFTVHIAFYWRTREKAMKRKD